MSQALKDVKGVAAAAVSFDDKRADVKYDADVVTPQKLVEAVNETGFQARLLDDERH